MKTLAFCFAIASALVGFVGAWYWLKSSKVSIERWGGNEPVPFPEERQEMLDRTTAMNTLWLGGMFEAAQETARLNKIAALWTAVAVILGAVSTVLSR